MNTPLALKLYRKGPHLGSGCQSSVFEATKKSDGKPFVLKVLPTNDESQRAMANNETELLKRFKGENHLVEFVEEFEDAMLEKKYIILEVAGNLTLENLMKEN